MRTFTSLLVIAVLTCNTILAQPGTLDESFGTNGKYVFFSQEGNIKSIAVLPDDKIVQTGTYAGIPYRGILLMRYNKDGGVDAKFGDSGSVITDLPEYYSETGIKVTALENGKILVLAEMSYSFENDVSAGIGVLRYNNDGTLDSSFGVNGLALTLLGKGSGYNQPRIYANSMAVQPDGKILVNGRYYANHTEGGSDFLFVRYLPDGSHDESFGNNGVSIIDHQFYDTPYDMELLNDGKIMLAINSGYERFLMRLLPDGLLDSAFGKNGVVEPDSTGSFTIFQLALQNDGRLISTGNDSRAIVVVRYREDGSIDRTFGDNGISKVRVDNLYLTPYDILVQKNNKIVVAGSIADEGTEPLEDFLVVRFKEDGTIDSSFGENGKTTTDFSDVVGETSYERAHSVALQSDGKIVLGGAGNSGVFPNYYYYFALARYHGDPVENPLIAKMKTWLRNNMLGWYTSNNSSINYYSIQRSSNGTNFTEEKRVQAENTPGLLQQATTREQQTFTYALNTAATNSYYRIAAVKKDGSIVYSDAVFYGGKGEALVKVFPNPVIDVLHVRGLNTSETSLIIINSQGNLVKIVSANASTYDLNVSSLQRGTYYLRVEDGGNSKTYPFRKE